MDIRVPTPPVADRARQQQQQQTPIQPAQPPKLMTLVSSATVGQLIPAPQPQKQQPPQTLLQQHQQQQRQRTESMGSTGGLNSSATSPQQPEQQQSQPPSDAPPSPVTVAVIERQLGRVMSWARQRLGRVIKNPKHFLQLFVKRAPLEYREELGKPGKKYACCVTLSGVRVGLATSSDRQKAVDRAHHMALTMLERYSVEEVLYSNPFEKPDLLRPGSLQVCSNCTRVPKPPPLSLIPRPPSLSATS
uniref:DRBM domain-containing protein n=1 Tax=Macrostomum lignano TaxID=282301 RepID=A0A1I8IHY6_9PLAT